MEEEWLHFCPSGNISCQFELINPAHLEAVSGQIEVRNMELVLQTKVVGNRIRKRGGACFGNSIVKDDLCRIFTICIIRFENGFAAAGAADLERDKGE